MFRAIFHLNCAEIASKLSLSDIIRRVLHILYIIFARQSTKIWSILRLFRFSHKKAEQRLRFFVFKWTTLFREWNARSVHPRASSFKIQPRQRSSLFFRIKNAAVSAIRQKTATAAQAKRLCVGEWFSAVGFDVPLSYSSASVSSAADKVPSSFTSEPNTGIIGEVSPAFAEIE